jgi:hypothetical protein
MVVQFWACRNPTSDIWRGCCAMAIPSRAPPWRLRGV